MPRAFIILIGLLVVLLVGAIVLGTINTAVPITHVEKPIPYAPPR